MIESPNISATGDNAIEQIKSYLFRLSEQLNLAQQSVDNKILEQSKAIASAATKKPTDAERVQDALDSFAYLKALIIKSADIIKAYEDVIEKDFNGTFVAQSAFGEYSEENVRHIVENSKFVDDTFSKVQENDKGYIISGGRIKTGYLGDNEQHIPIYGVEIGQFTKGNVDGEQVDKPYCYARFTADRLSFFGENGTELAYFSNNELHINKAHIDTTIQLGGYSVIFDNTYGTVFKWGKYELAVI